MNEGKKERTGLKSSLVNGVAGLCGNLASGVFYPLELIKLRMQVDEKKLTLRKITQEIYTKEGIRGFYRGFYYSIFASGISNMLFFSL